jgi:hypothetical protein
MRLLLLLLLAGCATHGPAVISPVTISEDMPVVDRPDYARHIVKHADGLIELTP